MATLRSVKANILRNYKLAGWISFDTVRWNSNDRKLYCGLNSIDGDLLYSFDPRCGQFECLNTKEWTDEFDVKIHRTLLLNPND